MNILDEHKEQINNICEQYHVLSLYLFGSASRNDLKDTSDIDLLIDFMKINVRDYFDNYMGLKEKLEQLLMRDIDLVEYQAIRNPIFREIVDREKRLIYERKSS